MATEEFEREASQMLTNMGLKDADTLHFFQSSNFTPGSGNQRWKEGLRKPTSPSRIRRFRSAPREPRTEVDGSAMRKYSVPVNRIHTRNSNTQRKPPENPTASDAAVSKPVQTAPSSSERSQQYVARTKSAPENGHRSPDSVDVVNGEQRSTISPRHQYRMQPSFKSTSPVKIVTQAPTSKPATIVKVKSTHIPVPVARTVPVQTVTKLPAPTPKHVTTFNVTEREEDKKSSTGTKVLYARKPSLKLLSVTTSTTTKVQSVADSSKSEHPSPKVHQKSTSHHHHPATTQPLSKSHIRTQHPATAIPASVPQLKHPVPPSPTGHVYQAYDRLEGYREIVLSSPDSANSDGRGSNPRLSGIICSASPTRCSSVNSDASQGSNVSVKSSESSVAYNKHPSGQSTGIPRLRKRSAPSSVSSSASHSRTPTPIAGHPYRKMSSPVRPVTDDSSQASANSIAGSTRDMQKNGNLSKLSLEHQISSASPEPEIVAMSILATNTVQALGTLMEVVTPTTSTENFDLFHSRDSQTKLDSSSSESPPSDKRGHSVPGEKRTPQSTSPLLMMDKPKSSTPAPAPENPQSSTSPPTHENSNLRDESSILPASSVNSALKRPPSSLKQKTGIPSALTAKPRKVSKPPPIPTRSNRKPTPLSPVETSSKLPSPKQNGFQYVTTSSAKLSDMNGGENDCREGDASSDACVEDDDSFFGYCHQCGKAVVGEETGCLALGKVFHTTCLGCSSCGKSLSGKTFYTVGQDILCEVDYLKRLQRCCFCNQRIKDKVLTAFGEVYHPACFRCAECGVCLDGVPYAGDSHDKVYCIKDYHQLFAPLCASCGKPIIPTPGKAKNLRVQVKDMYYHVRCYKCEDCSMLFASTKKQSFMVDGHLYCHKCHVKHTEAHVRTTIL